MTPAIIVRSRALQNILGLAAGIAAFMGAPTSANLAAAVTDEVGSGKVVFNNTPTLITPKYQDLSAAWTYNLTPSTLAANRAITLPALSADDVFVFQDQAQTLTNKTFTAPIVQTTSGAVNTVGMVSQTTVAAVNGTQSSSPLNYLRGFGFDTVAVASKPVDFGWETDPVQTAGNPAGIYRLYFRTNNGAWSSILSVGSTGGVTAANGLIATTTIVGNGITSNSLGITSMRNNIGAAAALGMTIQNTQAAANGAQQWSPGLGFIGNFWNSTGSASEQVAYTLEAQTVQNTDASASNLVLSRTASSLSSGAKTILTQFTAQGGLVTLTGITASSGTIQASAGNIISRRDNIQLTNTSSFYANNSTLSLVGTTVQQSPDILWSGGAWNSVGAVDERHDWRAFVLPATAAGTTSATWTLQRQIAVGGYSTVLSCTSGGVLQATNGLSISAGNFTVSAGSISTSASTITANRTNIAAATTLGISVSNTQTATNGSQHQWSPFFQALGRVWDGAANQNLTWKHEIQTTAGASYRGDYVFTYTDGGGAAEFFRLLGRTGGVQYASATTPATPSAGFVVWWHDSGSNTFKYKDSSGTVKTVTAV